MTRSILNGVDIFIVQTEFQKQKFAERGIPVDRIGVVPGFCPTIHMQNGNLLGDLITFVGRVSEEKGIGEFLDAARQIPDVPFAVAGAYNGMPGIRDCAPSNVQWFGLLGAGPLKELYLKSRIIVIPSRWYEGFPNVAVQAMTHARPIVAADIGALASIVDDNKTGLLFQPGNSHDLAAKLTYLYTRKDLCEKLGWTAQQKATTAYSPEKVYESLISIYEIAILHCNTQT
jgi:glycosyltransferase involved in cell wall biosynthesis